MEESKLNKAQMDFVHNFIKNDFRNATDAYMKAYPECSYHSARVLSSKALANVNIKAEIQKEIEIALSSKRLTLEKEVFDIWYTLATYDPADIVNDDGSLVHTMKELQSMGLSKCIASIKTKLNSQGDSVVEIELTDRSKAADKLAAYIQMIKPLPTVNLNIEKTTELTEEEERLYQEQLRAIRGEK